MQIVVVVFAASGCGSRVAPPPPVLPPPPPAPQFPGQGDISQRPFGWPLRLADAEEILLKTEVFAYGGWMQMRQVQAFNVLYEQPDATLRFRRLARQGRPAGKLYAFCALAELSPNEGVTLFQQLETMAERTVTIEENAISWKRVSEVAGIATASKLGTQFRRLRDKVDSYFKPTG